MSSESVLDTLDTSTVIYLIDHLFLPPRIDTHKCTYSEANESELDLLLFVHEVVSQFRASEMLASPTAIKRIDHIIKMLGVMTKLQGLPPGSDQMQPLLMKTLEGMEEGDIVTFYIKPQNAAVIFHHCGATVTFSSFEVSPPNSDVLASPRRLQCSYPTTTVSIPTKIFYLQSFLEQLTMLLSGPSAAYITNQPACGIRRGHHIKGPVAPIYITEFLTGLLRGIGQDVSLDPHDGRLIFKRIADEVLLAGSAIAEINIRDISDWKHTWRRSSIWLVIRVTLQISLLHSVPADTDGSKRHRDYKLLMLYILTKLLQVSIQSSRLGVQLDELSTEKLSHMSRKVARRAAKLEAAGLIIRTTLLEYVSVVVRAAVRVLETRFEQIRATTVRELRWPRVGELDVDRDTNLTMVKSRPYIESVLKAFRERTTPAVEVSASFSRDQPPRIIHDTSQFQMIFRYAAKLDTIKHDHEQLVIILKDIERWVETTLEDFISANINREEACCELHQLLASYSTAANSAYSHSPVDNSLKLLTCIELFVAIEKVATSIIPLLKDYPCEVDADADFLMALLLPTNAQLKRLQKVTTYLKTRRARATRPSIFRGYRNEAAMTDQDRFSVVYFDRSPLHQALLDRIIRDVMKSRSTESLLLAITSDVGTNAKTIVFELDLPLAFAEWRDATYRAVALFPTISWCPPLPYSTADSELARYYIPRSRLVVCDFEMMTQSQVKAKKTKSRRRARALNWSSRSVECRFMAAISGTKPVHLDDTLQTESRLAEVRRNCTFQLPSVSSTLQYAVDSTNHTSNYVLYKQSDRPAGWSPHEYYAFAMLRAGFRLQWLNILREIKAGNLCLNRVEVVYLFLQTSWQVGPQGGSDNYLRETHEILHNVVFCNQMLDALEDCLTMIKENWLQQLPMLLVISLGARILSIAKDRQIKIRAACFLRLCRAACMDWLLDILRHIHSSPDDINLAEWQARSLAVAATCRQTFDVDLDVLFAVFNSERDLGDFIECAACVHRIAEQDPTGYLEHTQLLNSREASLAHGMEPHLRDLIFTNNDWFHSAISRILPQYVAGGQWEVLDAPNDRWITTKSGGDMTMNIHYNLLEGALLIDEIPLANLSKKYVHHPLYTRLFQNQTFLVVKADMPGMEFQTVHSVFGTDSQLMLYFGMRNRKLIIRTKRGAAVHEFIPHTRLVGDFPETMLSPYAHFLDLNQQKLEFRPMSNDESIWDPSNCSWAVTISKFTDDLWSAYGHRTLPCGRELKLIDYHSPTQGALAEVFQSIEPLKSNIELTFSPKANKIYLKLARYGLEFDFDGTQTEDTQIACRTFPGMVIDVRPRVGQDMGTLYGLKTYLVLREAKLRTSADTRRTAIIPHGEVHYSESKYNTTVWIDTCNMTTVRYHLYSIDSLLGRFVSNGGMESLLFKIYLHALTSYCLPDPLTGSTGTQAALDDLRSGRVWSPQRFDADELGGSSERKILHLLFKLTPVRTYLSLSDGTEVPVQRVDWCPRLPSFCQHGEFYFITKSILQHWQKISKSQEHWQKIAKGPEHWIGRKRPLLPDFLDLGSKHLQERATTREAVRLANDDEGRLYSHLVDHVYAGRGFSDPSLEARVCRISKLTNEWTANLRPTPTLRNLLSQLKWLRNDTAGKTIGYHSRLHYASLTDYWCPLYEFCRNCSPKNDKYRLLFVLSAFAYSTEERTPMILLETILAIATNPIFSALPLPIDFTCRQHHSVTEVWIRHMDAVQAKLDIIRSRARRSPPLPTIDRYRRTSAHQPPLSAIKTVKGLQRLLYTKPAPPAQHEESAPKEPQINPAPKRGSGRMEGLNPLKELLNRFSKSASGFHRRYSNDLKQSFEALNAHKLNKPLVTLPSLDRMESYVQQSMMHMENMYQIIVGALTSEPDALTVEGLLDLTSLKPRISVKSILVQLPEMKNENFPPEWKKILVSFGKSVTLYQRATRMYRATRRADLLQFTKEWENKGYVGWDPLEFPEWLLFEIENNLLIRPLQARTAIEMITPHTHRNAVMQLNMGEGKSSVIVPIVAATLADRQKLVRIVVLQPLWNQMFDLLTKKLGGLLNRRIYHAPFSRELKDVLSNDAMSQIQDIFKECMDNGGVFLTQPEHLLSFKLMGVDMLCAQKESEVVDEIFKTQHWLHKNARDIFDESDELLHARYELIYTIGMEQPLEFGTQRWVMIQEILTLVRKYIWALKKQYPLGVDLMERENAPGSFPFARLLENDAEVMLMGEIASKIITTNLGQWIPHKDINDRIYDLTLQYVLDRDAKEEILSDLGEIPPAVLLLKGLIGHGIIAFVLREKRWKVDYGLHNSNLAIPYRAKDCPVPRAQFAHPDLRIALTCLCYYYEGLTETQLHLCFQRLPQLSDPEREYLSWIMECKMYLPPPLRRLNGVNLDDTHQWSHSIYPLLKMTKRVIDFYLSVEVFPAECKEFPAKLSTSAWDLAEERTHPTTGFSGTNDNRYLLPLSIEQLDLDSQVHINAKVLSYLLRPENGFYECVQTAAGQRLSERELILKMVDAQNCPAGQIQVLIDVGAQLLEMDNEQVARYWLSLATHRDSKWTAALFFNIDGELTVIGKEGGVQPYRSSPYIENMASCLAYLDEAHTRGTDIKLPADSVAAVTLGPKLTKDKLVQACMRMRNLGHGQSVRFFAPPEVNWKILDHSKREHYNSNQETHIKTIDILTWVMHETYTQTQQSVALWARQGIAYQDRQGLWKANINYENFPAVWKETESKTLTEMYSTSYKESSSMMHIIDRKLCDDKYGRKKELFAIKLRCEEYQTISNWEPCLQEQQEREVARETLREYFPENKLAIPIEPHTHELHPSLVNFIDTGVPPVLPDTPDSPFCTLMDTLRQTSFSSQIEEEPWTTQILTTVDFSLTVEFCSDESSELDPETGWYLRPVTWIMSTGAVQDGSLTLIILSPFEANELLPHIRKSKFVNLHMYSAKVQRLTPSFYDLTSLAIPALVDKSKWQNMYPEREELMIQINLYAGELFFGSYEIYRKTCAFLGIGVRGGGKQILRSVGWKSSKNDIYEIGQWGNEPGDGGTEVSGCKAGKVTFQRNPLEFLTNLVEARGKGTKIIQTHMGFLLQGKILETKHWEEEGANDSGDEDLSDTDDASEEDQG